jgi:hypothetical protein
MQTVLDQARSDSAGPQKTLIKDEDKPPPLAADTYIADAIAKMKRRAYYKSLYDGCDALESRIDALARKERAKMVAAKALRDAEEKYTSPPDPDTIWH